MSEMAQTADHLIILGRGRIVADAPVSEILAGAEGESVQVRTPRVVGLSRLLEAEGAIVRPLEDDLVSVTRLTAPRIAELAAAAGIGVHGLTPVARSLEDAYMELTRDDVEYRSTEATR